jgi:hypothetical protein
MNSVLDILRPLQILQRNLGASRLVQRILDNARRVETVHGLALTAARDILGDVGFRNSGVCDFEWRVLSKAVVEHVRRVEVFNPQACSEVANAVVDLRRDCVGDLVQEIGERIGRGAVFGEQSFTEEGGIELQGGVS